MILHRCFIGVVFLHICVIHGVCSSSSLVSAPSPSSCQHHTPEKCGSLDIPYPFSLRNNTHCPPVHPSFQLSCDASKPSASLELGFAQLEVLRFSPGGITINPGNCSRPNLHSFNLSMTRFTLSPYNLLVLHNCRTACPVNHTFSFPTDNSACNFNVSTCYQILNESEPMPRDVYSNASMEAFTQGFLNLANFSTKFNCSTFTSWVYSSSAFTFNADYGLKLNWSIQGFCSSRPCSESATCNQELEGYFCQCKPGFEGDGYVAGAGCTIPVPASSPTSCDNCNSSSAPNILKTAIITAGIIALATIVAAVVVACAVMKSRSSSALQDAKKSDSRCLADLLTFGQSETFTFKQLDKATKGFASSGMLGNGAFGTVYAGTLEDNRRVAVKRIHYLSFHGLQQIANEVNVLSSVQHRNLVRLLGCCIEGGDPLLVFEFVSNGTLAEHLQRERGHGLDWFTRLTIAAETADALAYLHSMDPPIFHRDVKSTNILLDEDFNTKVADFGISRMGLSLSEGSHVSTAPQGTPGYVDPEYHQNFHLSDKSDVYSFGVVLMEIITALKPVDFSREKKQVNLAALAVAKIGSGSVDDIIDKFLQADKRPNIRAMVQRVAELAFRCLAFDKDVRPSMAEVLEELLLIRGGTTPIVHHQQSSPRIIRHDDSSFSGNRSAIPSPSSTTITTTIAAATTTTTEPDSSETDRLLRSKSPSVDKQINRLDLDALGDALVSSIGSSIP